MKTTKLVSAVLAAALALSATACGSSAASSAAASSEAAPASSAASSEAASSEAAAEPTEVIVFAAASLTETLTEIGDTYMKENPDVTLLFTFDSSGTLKTQIEEGADCDVFISAGQKQMNQLDITASTEVNADGLDFVEDGTRKNLLENKVTLVVSDDNKAGIDSFDTLAKDLEDGSILFAMGNSDVPVGQYTQKILAYYNLDEQKLADSGVITYGSNVKEVTTQVKEGSVDAGVVYCTDAFSAGLTVVDEATKDMCGQVIYPAALIKSATLSEHKDAAQAFLDYLSTDEAMKVFEGVGFAAV